MKTTAKILKSVGYGANKSGGTLFPTAKQIAMTMYRRLTFFLGGAAVAMAVAAQDAGGVLDTPMPEGWNDDSEVFQQTLPVDDRWWELFNDPTLDSLIAVATERNYSVETALMRMEQARRQVAITRGGLLPTLELGGGWTRQQTGGETRSWSGKYNLTATMSWEIDVFGAVRGRIRAEQENFRASADEVNAVMVSLCAQVATSYINLRQYQQERKVLLDNCRSQQAVVELTEARQRSGLSSSLDVAQARSVYYGTLASVPAVEADIVSTMNQLAVLLGSYPQNMVPGLVAARPLPQYIEVVGVGVPAGLLRRRPDVRKAERQVSAQAALYGVSKKQWLPTFFLNGSVGYGASELSGLVKANSLSWQLAPSVSWTLFDGGSRYNSVRQSRAALDEAIGQYNLTVMQAMQEAENAMASYKNSLEQIVATRQALNMSTRALELSLDLYKQGLSPFQNVLDAQRSQLSYEDALVQAQGASLVNLVSLYQALGGGWEP